MRPVDMTFEEDTIFHRAIMDSINDGISSIDEDFQYHYGGDPY